MSAAAGFATSFQFNHHHHHHHHHQPATSNHYSTHTPQRQSSGGSDENQHERAYRTESSASTYADHRIRNNNAAPNPNRSSKHSGDPTVVESGSYFVSNHFRMHQLHVLASPSDALVGAGQCSAAASNSTTFVTNSQTTLSSSTPSHPSPSAPTATTTLAVSSSTASESTNPDETCWLLALPHDLLHEILLILDAKSLAMLACTCRALRDLAQNDVYWKHLFRVDRHTWPHYGAPVPNRAFTSKRQLYLAYTPNNPAAVNGLHVTPKPSARGIFKTMKRAVLGQAVRMAIFGPGLENAQQLPVVSSLLFNPMSPLRATRMYPGIAGVGSGVGVSINGIVLNLMTLYRSTQAKRRTTSVQQVNQLSDGFGRLSREMSQLCKTVDTYAFVVDATQLIELSASDRELDPERAEAHDSYIADARIELSQLLSDYNVAKDAPLMVWAVELAPSDASTWLPAPIANNSNAPNPARTADGSSDTAPYLPWKTASGKVRTASAATVADALELHSIARPWRVFSVDMSTFQNVRDSVAWSVSQI
ncbi:hypothetical protein CAOG_03934 [Capsaspora owczarzaki ATCC 30864]|uniref:F-box domain-containing protein n=1 Tax=Capsaspora owczarzaki (strain ATCC 30864) TaxID=595528 RepID=A0A0D2WQC9_CAPO3|nr:hypothetical protein CAOG_03934 [Capsaspora owczarzaki ATCC 30864]KJE93093.1 hypothetical protein CAOG_003934 [Capsaspora owczarzaki ATCC 30864]|eukprot:XP_004363662.1 hypothetical protein CAOG_03934 [Capsaspora owczarzaki ATCC 30864]